MYVIITSKVHKENKALEEILSLIFQKDTRAKVIEIKVKPGLSIIETNLNKNEIKKILFRIKRAYTIKIIPIDIILDDPKEAVKFLILNEKEKFKDKQFAVRCSKRYGVSSKFIEEEVGKILKENNFKINLKNPDYILLIEPIKEKFYISLLSLKEYYFFTTKKRI